MSNMIYAQPCLLYEALELAIATVNQVPAERLTAAGPYCVPVEVVEQLLERAGPCLPLESAELRFYFSRQNIPTMTGRPVTLASTLLYAFICFDPGEKALDTMLECWEHMRQGRFRVLGVNEFTLEFAPQHGEGRTLLSAELNRHKLPVEYRMAVMECFSDFSYHLRHIWQLLQPLMRLLEAELAPWVQNASPLLEQWHAQVEELSCEEYLLDYLKMTTDDGVRQMRIALRYLDCRNHPGQTDALHGILWTYMGVSAPAVLRLERPAEALPIEVLRAFHLLGDRGRAELLHAIGNGMYTMQDLSVQLHQNSGTVFKNLTALSNAGILLQECSGGRRYYRIRKDMLRSVLRQVEAYILPED